ncbi:MAG: recombinase family protein [Dactylosporangium sp.]|nr:recombinase family protein [Dactylosporangium sp.]NNJ61744.1 recombinase family protein [Dactylosporangium sp.]
MEMPQKAIGYVRLSELRTDDLNEDGDGKGNVDQIQRIKQRAKDLGWAIVHMIVENDLSPGRGKNRPASAFKRRRIRLPDGRVEMRTVRPGFRQALDLLATRKADGFMALDLDRTVRDPRDLEDMIDVVEQHKVLVDSVTGSLRLGNDADITMARVMVAVANKESRDKARRVAAARERQAVAGEYGGGRRPFGFDEDGLTVRPDEAKVIEDCTVRFVQGASMRSLAADLRERAVPTVTGTRWTAQTLRDILMRPRNAGRMVYQGEEIGDAPWDPIVPLDTFRALQLILADPDRRVGPGAAPRWLGSNLYCCGICTDEAFTNRVGVQVRIGGRQPAYRCTAHNHLVRAVKHVDALVEATILGRLAREDAVDLLPSADPDVDVKGLRTEAAAIRAGLNELAADKALGLIDRAQLIAGTQRGKARLARIEAVLQEATVDSPLASLIGADDVAAVWEGLPLSHRRLVVDALVTVRILPTTRKGRGFDPATIDLRWREQDHPAESA